MIRIKRAYEPVERRDGQRILVERLWPRGMTKDALAADAWMRDVAPSTALRKWFDHRVERWEEFQRRYRDELDANPSAWKPLLEASEHGTVTLLYSAHDTLHNGALVLRDHLLERAAPRARRTSKAVRTRRAATTPRRGHPVNKSSKKDAAKREILRRPHKDDFHEQREHEQEQTGVLRSVSHSIGPTRGRRGAPKPVRVAPKVSRKIAVVTDLSLSSRRAVDLAAELSLRLRAELVVVHCVEATVPPYPVPFTPNLRTLTAAAREALDTEVKRVREVVPAAHKKLLEGCGAEPITAFLEDGEVVLLVLGTTDATGRGLLDGVAEKVAESSRVPVLIVRAKTVWLGGIPTLDEACSAAGAAALAHHRGSAQRHVAAIPSGKRHVVSAAGAT
jgi:uncharacterized protein YeaO (DUF488 family)/nucleotide-binding universal stress UspA family protein